MASSTDSSGSNRQAFLGIGGDVDNYLLPFNGPENKRFSFRDPVESNSSISICPSSIRTMFKLDVNNDISLNNTVKEGFEQILKSIPAIQIREYAQDPRLMQIQNIFSSLIHGFKEAGQNVDENKLFDNLKENIAKFPNLVESIAKGMEAFRGGVDNRILSPFKSTGYTQGDGVINRKFILDFPFIMYYQIMSSKTTGFYTLPYSGKLVDQSNGAQGWNNQHGVQSLGTSANSILGKIINFVGHNIKFNTTPVWDGSTTNDYPAMEVQFELFNDTDTAALNNFIFLNHIMPKNRFLQYHAFQHSPSIYDVKIEGYGRFYMCSGSVTCEYKGVSRVPSQKFFDGLSSKVSDNYKAYLTKDNLKLEKLVRIPDVYSFKLTLTSLLPNSLNNYLFRYSGNHDMENKSESSTEFQEQKKMIEEANMGMIQESNQKMAANVA